MESPDFDHPSYKTKTMIKNTAILSCVMILSLSYGCVQTNEKASKDDLNKQIPSENYTAFYEQDTAKLTIIRKGKKVEGNLSFSYGNGIRDTGTIKGVIKGDTLLTDYHHQSQKGGWQRNPVALLKKGTRLYMGLGETKFEWGRTYFVNPAAIDYEKGRFVFVRNN
jgi:hypothetical protein